MSKNRTPLDGILEPLTEHGYALMRVVAGAMFTFHGLQKVFGMFSENTAVMFSQIWIGGVIELVAGIAITIGFHTRLAAFLASGTMAVAYAQFHWKFQFGDSFFPTLNGGELALLYAVVFFLIACKGGGLCSLDRGSRS